LPPAASDLANEIMRDPYNFDFLALRKEAAERELEEGLLTHMRKFVIELGAVRSATKSRIFLKLMFSGASLVPVRRNPKRLTREGSRTFAHVHPAHRGKPEPR